MCNLPYTPVVKPYSFCAYRCSGSPVGLGKGEGGGQVSTEEERPGSLAGRRVSFLTQLGRWGGERGGLGCVCERKMSLSPCLTHFQNQT